MTSGPLVRVDFHPELREAVARFVIGPVHRMTHPQRPAAASVQVLDHHAWIEPASDPATLQPVDPLEVAYAPGPMLSLAVGVNCLVAVAGNACLAVFCVTDADVVLPGGTTQNIDDFVATHQGRVLPDFYGLQAEVEP
jgi:hypothetical protein